MSERAWNTVALVGLFLIFPIISGALILWVILFNILSNTRLSETKLFKDGYESVGSILLATTCFGIWFGSLWYFFIR